MLRLFSSGHLGVIAVAVASGFIAGTAPVTATHVCHMTNYELLC